MQPDKPAMPDSRQPNYAKQPPLLPKSDVRSRARWGKECASDSNVPPQTVPECVFRRIVGTDSGATLALRTLDAGATPHRADIMASTKFEGGNQHRCQPRGSPCILSKKSLRLTAAGLSQ